LLEPEQPWSNPNQPGDPGRLKPFDEIKAKERGWTLDALNIVRRIAEILKGQPLRGLWRLA